MTHNDKDLRCPLSLSLLFFSRSSFKASSAANAGKFGEPEVEKQPRKTASVRY